MRTIVKFKPKRKISRIVDNKLLIVFYPTTEYEGEIVDCIVIAESNKYKKTFEIKLKDVQILNYI